MNRFLNSFRIFFFRGEKNIVDEGIAMQRERLLDTNYSFRYMDVLYVPERRSIQTVKNLVRLPINLVLVRHSVSKALRQILFLSAPLRPRYFCPVTRFSRIRLGQTDLQRETTLADRYDRVLKSFQYSFLIVSGERVSMHVRKFLNSKFSSIYSSTERSIRPTLHPRKISRGDKKLIWPISFTSYLLL